MTNLTKENQTMNIESMNIDTLSKVIKASNERLQKMIELTFGSEKSMIEIRKEGEYLINLIKARQATVEKLYNIYVEPAQPTGGAGCICPNELAWQYSGGICLICNKPRR
jgi:hypothetical protein